MTINVFWQLPVHGDGAAISFLGDPEDALFVTLSLRAPLEETIEIDGVAYWDGGLTANPPLLPLIHGCAARDLVAVLLQPQVLQALGDVDRGHGGIVAAPGGVTWHFDRPPVVDLEFEMDCRSVGQEWVA